MANVNAIEILRDKLRPWSMGGELMEKIIGGERVGVLRKSRTVSLQLGEQLGASVTPTAELWARSYDYHVLHEPQNLDWKISSDVPLPTEEELEDAFSPEKVVVTRGNTTSNRHMNEMIMAEFDRGDGTTRRLRLSHPNEKRDRRWREDTTVFGRLALNHLGQIVDVHTHEVVELGNLPRERFIVDGESKNDSNFLLIQSSRYIWNLMLGNRVINLNQVDSSSWVPDVKDKEWNEYLNFAMEVPFLIMEGKIDESTLDEFRNRMMGCFCINPKLFLNLTNHFHFSAIFPYFSKHEIEYKFYEDVDDVPEDAGGFKEFVVMMMGPDYDESLSVLANLASVFKIGIGNWTKSDTTLGSDLVS